LGNLLRENIGCGAKNKRLPYDFMSWGKDALYGILSGLLDTDGSISISNGKAKPQYMANYVTISHELHLQIQQLLAILGVRSSVLKYERNGNAVYHITLSMVDLIKIREHLQLTIPKKAKLLKEAIITKDDTDIVPISFKLAKDLQKIITPNVDKILYTILSKATSLGYILRETALRIIDTVEEYKNNYNAWKENFIISDDIINNLISCIKQKNQELELKSLLNEKAYTQGFYNFIKKAEVYKAVPVFNAKETLNADEFNFGLLENWKNEFVLNTNLYWDIIKTVEPDVETTGYDLTVPGPYVFMTSNLLTVQDTMSMMVPVTQEGMKEAEQMFPSRILYKHGDNQLVPSLSKDYVFGLYELSLIEEDSGKKFKDIDEAKLSGLDWNKICSIGGKKNYHWSILNK
jgi:hypothetical protein